MKWLRAFELHCGVAMLILVLLAGTCSSNPNEELLPRGSEASEAFAEGNFKNYGDIRKVAIFFTKPEQGRSLRPRTFDDLKKMSTVTLGTDEEIKTIVNAIVSRDPSVRGHGEPELTGACLFYTANGDFFYFRFDLYVQTVRVLPPSFPDEMGYHGFANASLARPLWKAIKGVDYRD